MKSTELNARQPRSRQRCRAAANFLVLVGLGLWSGCSGRPFDSPPTLFTVPLIVEGEDVGGAIVDTGGGFEVLLRDAFGLPVIESATVVAFGGIQNVGLTGPFQYEIGGLKATAAAGIVDPTICNCNGIGFEFLRNTGLVLSLSFDDRAARFMARMPDTEMELEFLPGESDLVSFDTAFVDVVVASGDDSRRIRALLDTGATNTVLRAGIVGAHDTNARFQEISVTHELLGTVALGAGLFETPGIPDMIIGTDVMGTWADRWYFHFLPKGGRVGVIRDWTSWQAKLEAAPESAGGTQAATTSSRLFSIP